MQNSIINRLLAIVAWHYEKTNSMKPKITSHEIMLFAGTGFTNREFSCRDNDRDNDRKFSPMEALEKACWEGMLYELFPELPGSFSAKCENFIWQIMSGKNFLHISMGTCPAVIENETTIDPYFFLLSSCEN